MSNNHRRLYVKPATEDDEHLENTKGKDSYTMQVMSKENKKPGRFAKAMLVTAKDMRHVGLIDEANCRKITLRHLGVKEKFVAEPPTGEDIQPLISDV